MNAKELHDLIDRLTFAAAEVEQTNVEIEATQAKLNDLIVNRDRMATKKAELAEHLKAAVNDISPTIPMKTIVTDGSGWSMQIPRDASDNSAYLRQRASDAAGIHWDAYGRAYRDEALARIDELRDEILNSKPEAGSSKPDAE